MITLDMNHYKRALKLEYISDKYKDKWWLLPCAFHTIYVQSAVLERQLNIVGWMNLGLYLVGIVK